MSGLSLVKRQKWVFEEDLLLVKEAVYIKLYEISSLADI